MKHRYLAYLVLLVTLTALFTACGGGGGGGAPALPGGSTLKAFYPDYFTTQPETFALANGTDTARITVDLHKADGTTADDGTPVRFTLPAGVTFANTSSATTVTTTGGTASVTLSHAAVTAPATNVTVPVTATALGGVGAVNVKFINQPTTVDVSVALTPSIVGVEAVQLDMENKVGIGINKIPGGIAGGVLPASQPTWVGINAGVGGNFAVSFDAANNLSRVGMIAYPGINTTDKVPIVKITYGLVIGGAVGVADFTPIAPFIVAGAGGAPLIPGGPTTLNFAITFRYNTE